MSDVRNVLRQNPKNEVAVSFFCRFPAKHIYDALVPYLAFTLPRLLIKRNTGLGPVCVR
jgi:hypothetical protein